ncbi:MAG TPA: hypothetical protein VN692_09695 [Steroidobacteraceae bacterium]|nr:hypothetical protein [Steroidobacteraceae bacterium]
MSSTPTAPTITWTIRPAGVSYESTARALGLRFEHAGFLPRGMSAPIAALMDLLRGELAALPAVAEYAAWLAAAREKRVVIGSHNFDQSEYLEALKGAESRRQPALAAIIAHARDFAEKAGKDKTGKDTNPTPALLKELTERCQDLLLQIAAVQQIQSARTQLGGSGGEEAAGQILDTLLPR